jgi:hypothetical protein
MVGVFLIGENRMTIKEIVVCAYCGTWFVFKDGHKCKYNNVPKKP